MLGADYVEYMGITTKGMIMTENFFNKSNDYYLFHLPPKPPGRRIFKEVSMHYLCNKLP